jgi:glycosyltransferase involved in cell wall biosynthesis
MRIAFFTEAYDPFVNGVVVLVKHFRQELLDRGHQVVVFAPEYPGYRDADPDVVRLPSIRWSSMGYPCTRFFSGVCWHFDHSFDLVHSHHPFSTGALAEKVAWRYNRPLIYTFHTLLTNYTDYVAQYLPFIPPQFRERLLWSVCHRHIARAGRVTVSTPVMERFLRRYQVTTPVSLVTPTHQLAQPAPDARRRLRGQLGVPDEAALLLYAGRLAHEKCVDFLLRAAAEIDRSRPWRLVLLGEGPLAGELPVLAERLGIADRVSFPGLVPHEQMADWYAAADIFTFPSRNETFGLVLLEAMRAGLPPVVIAANGPLDIVQQRHSGLLTDFEPQAYARAIDRLLADPALRATLAAGARRRAAKLTAVPTGDQLLAAYEALLAAHAGKRHG